MVDWASMVEVLRLKQKKAAPRLEPVYHVVVRYSPFWKEWEVIRYDSEDIELEYQRFPLQGAARYIARTWMDMYNVTRVYVYQMNGKVKEVIMQGDKEAV